MDIHRKKTSINFLLAYIYTVRSRRSDAITVHIKRIDLSRSLKVIGTDTDISATHDFLLTCDSYASTYLVSFPRHSEILAENRDSFSEPARFFNAPAEKRYKRFAVLMHYTSVSGKQTDGRTPADDYTALIRNIYIFIHYQMVAAHTVKNRK